MNRYGQTALDFNLRHRSNAISQISDREAFFAREGEAIAAEVTRLRDELLGPTRAGESLEAYRLRSYQALTTAEEITLAGHYLFQPEEMAETAEDPSELPDLDRRYEELDAVNRAINTPL